VLDSLRQKRFSHSSITETAKELGGVSRTLVSENFRGLVFKMLTEHEFEEQNTAKLISNSDDEEINDRVKSKMQTFLKNIQDSIKEFPQNDFAFAKEKLSSKYKNLPQKFHPYLDEVIKHLLK
jgi:ribosomal protein S20